MAIFKSNHASATSHTTADEVETIIGHSVQIEGTFASKGHILIEGSVQGKLQTSLNLRIGERAKIQADIEAANAIIAGEVHGNVTIAESLEVLASARIFGDVACNTLSMEKGAQLNGSCSMKNQQSGIKQEKATQDWIEDKTENIEE